MILVVVVVVVVVVEVVVVVVVVVEAAVGSVELQRERETHCKQCRVSERLTVSSVEPQRDSLSKAERSNS